MTFLLFISYVEVDCITGADADGATWTESFEELESSKTKHDISARLATS